MYKEIFCRNAQDLSKGILSELSTTSALEYQNVAEVTRTLCDQHRVIFRKLFWLRDVAGLFHNSCDGACVLALYV